MVVIAHCLQFRLNTSSSEEEEQDAASCPAQARESIEQYGAKDAKCVSTARKIKSNTSRTQGVNAILRCIAKGIIPSTALFWCNITILKNTPVLLYIMKVNLLMCTCAYIIGISIFASPFFD